MQQIIPNRRTQTLNTISRLTLTRSGLASCGYCLRLLSQIAFVTMPCKNSTRSPFVRLVTSCRPYSPPITNTRHSKETRNSTTCPFTPPRVHYSVLLSRASKPPPFQSSVLMFTSLSSPGRLYELSFSSSAQLDSLNHKCVYILTLRPLHDNGLIIFPIGTPIMTLFRLFSPVSRAAALVDTFLLYLFRFLFNKTAILFSL